MKPGQGDGSAEEEAVTAIVSHHALPHGVPWIATADLLRASVTETGV